MKLKIRIIVFALFFCSLIPVTKAQISVGNLTHEKAAKVGETYQGVISIKNSAKKPKEVKVYQTDYLFFFDGRNVYGEPGKASRSNADWITFRPKRLTIPPEETSLVHYTVKVPEDETLVGTYWSMLMVECISENSPEAGKSEEEEVTLSIKEVIRYGIQMVTHIGNTGTGELKFLKTELLKGAERRILQIDIENIGKRWVAPFLWVELYNEEGSYIDKFESKRKHIYPGTSVRYSLDLSRVAKGEYKALVVADGGGNDVFGTEYTLRLEK